MRVSPQSDLSTASDVPAAVESFIARWRGQDGGERSNYQLFISELCDLLEVPRPYPASSDNTENAYIFERSVSIAREEGRKEGRGQKEEGKRESSGGQKPETGEDPQCSRSRPSGAPDPLTLRASPSPRCRAPSEIQNPKFSTAGFIDCYKRGAFVFETKQGVEKKAREALSEAGKEREAKRRSSSHGVRGTSGWDTALLRAKNQADRYARNLPASEGRPPFLIVADVGHCIELYSEFTRSGGIYTQFPDARSSRIMLEDLRRPEIRERLRLVWTDPLSLDPARRTAAVTRDISVKLAALSKSLEADGHDPQLAAYFLMRCIFTMFAEDVKLIPKGAFSEMLKSLRGQVDVVPSMLETLWRAMDSGEFFPAVWFRQKLLRFNGGLFRDPRALAITDDQLELLIEAAKADWREVEPAIFGTLLERALEPTERHKLGAHYTPRAYVERLVLPTVIEPLRADWQAVQAAAVQLAGEDKKKQALAEIEKFHRHLCHIRVLDPACGTGNFLYVTLEHLKRLEGEVLDALERFGGNRSLEMDTATVRPSQMRGIEINPRAAVIAELVLWIGYLQWHLRTNGDVRTVSEPVLEDAKNIESRDAILAYDSKEIVRDESGRPQTHWDGRTTKPHPVTGRPVPDEHAQLPIYSYENPRPAEWPQADYIVGNPPFIGASRMRDALGDGYVETVRKTIKSVPESADYVMYWWNHAADLVREGKARRFGFVTTNSLRQTFNRRVLESHLNSDSVPAKKSKIRDPKSKIPLSLLFAIPDHPWVDDVEAAAVRVAMTVAEAGNATGLLQTVESEEPGDESYKVTFKQRVGKIAADLTIGANTASATPLRGNEDLSNHGVIRGGEGFLVSKEKALELGLGRVAGLERHLRPIVNGKDLTQQLRGAYVIDLYGLREREVQTKFPEVYQHLLIHVKPVREQSKRATRRENWWLFNESVPKLRRMLVGLSRYISTSETAKHRIFAFLDHSVLPEHKLVNIALEDGFHLGVLSSRVHLAWATACGSLLEDRPVYVKSTCFETFPFPDCTDAQRARIRELGEALDAHRKSRQAAHPDLTMTGMYNALEKLRSGDSLTAKEKTIHEHGLVSVLKQLHEDLDAAVFDAYGWGDILKALDDLEKGYATHLGTGNQWVIENYEETKQVSTRLFAKEVDEEILTRLVALNHERAEEETRGHIRWLRPEYQAPDAAPTQAELAGTAAPSKPTTTTKQPSTAQSWPKALPDQIRAVRSALEILSIPADAAAIAKLFKGARKDRIEDILESLQALGHAYEVHDGRYSA